MFRTVLTRAKATIPNTTVPIITVDKFSEIKAGIITP
jgi:hypothetical protein